MANLLTTQILNDIQARMYDLEDTFAVHNFLLLKPDVISDKFDNNTNYDYRVQLKCFITPRTRVDESDSMLFDDLGTTPKQQINLFVFKREIKNKGFYDTNTNELLIKEEDQLIFGGEQYYINQISPIGFFQIGAELIKIRATKKISTTDNLI